MTPPDPRVLTWARIKALEPCTEALDWGKQQFARRRTISATVLLTALIDAKHLSWANWLIVRLMDKLQRVAYAIFSAEQVLAIYEQQYPDDGRPRKAIDAAKAYVAEPSLERQNMARAASAASAYAASAASAYAAYAASAASVSAYAASAASDTARSVKRQAAHDEMLTRIIKHGMELLDA